MAIQSDTAASLLRSSAEVAAEGWEKLLSVHVWVERREARVSRSDLCWMFRRVPGKFTPVESAALNIPWDKVVPQHRSRASRRQKDGSEKL